MRQKRLKMERKRPNTGQNPKALFCEKCNCNVLKSKCKTYLELELMKSSKNFFFFFLKCKISSLPGQCFPAELQWRASLKKGNS